MHYNFYSKTNKHFLDGLAVGICFYLAFLIRYAGAIPVYDKYQFWSLVIPLTLGRLLVNHLSGVNRIQWRYVGVTDAIAVARSYLIFSCFLLLLRALLPASSIARVPGSIITIEFLLSLMSALGIRIVRRYLFERQSRRSNQAISKGPRRLLLIGAGMMGAKAAKELAGDSSVEIVG